MAIQTLPIKLPEKITSDVFMAAGVLAVLFILLVPLPTFMLDILLTFSIAIGVIILMVSMYTTSPLNFSVFPSLLLIVTLYRLALNIASTRIILLHGAEGEMAAGRVIHTFGQFVVGGSYVVGFVVFAIFVLINFVVITKGATRIGEVTARFTLDAMPGKQMAIDADLNAGIITDKDAKARRDAIVKESEFYGAMDGASKFISGDAKAGLIITAINLVGGILLGWTRGMDVGAALQHYAILSIGDGLVSQIPSIIIAVSSGFLVSKIRSDNTVSFDMTRQMIRHTQPMMITAGIVAAFAFVPGLPKIPFIAIAGVFGVLSYLLREEHKKESHAPTETPAETTGDDAAPPEEMLHADILSVLVGVRLINLVDPRRKSGVFERIGALRKKIAQKFGFIMPLVRLRDNLNLDPTTYEIRLYDHVIASGKIEPDKFLAMDAGGVQTPIKGVPAKEPVYGLPALWINEADKENAEINGYTVIDPESVLITHLSETISRHAHEFLTREDVQQLVERLRKSQPSLVGEVVPEVVSIGQLQRVLQNLLKENVPIRDLPLILESLGEHGGKSKSAVLLTEFVRKAISRSITEQFSTYKGLEAITLDPALEHYLLGKVSQTADAINLSIAPDTAGQITQSVAAAWRTAMEKGLEGVVVLCDARIRSGLHALLSRSIRRLPVLAYDEVVPGTSVNILETVSVHTAELESAASLAAV